MEIKTCPLHSGYKFKTKCCVTTCKFHSTRTRNNCLGLDITFSSEDKPFSDHELLHYKFPHKELSVKDVTKLRKRAVEQVKHLIMLQRIISVLTETKTETDGFNYVEGKSNIIDDLITSEPLTLKKLHFETWMLTLIFDESLTTSIVGAKFKLKDALQLSNKDFLAAQKALKILDSGNTLFNNVV